jgi:hypothetical protein
MAVFLHRAGTPARHPTGIVFVHGRAAFAGSLAAGFHGHHAEVEPALALRLSVQGAEDELYGRCLFPELLFLEVGET